MALTHFIVETPAPGYGGFALGSQVNADVIFRELFNRGDIALATGETPPVGIVPAETRAKIVNGVLQDASGSPGVQLKCDQAALNLTAPLQYHVAFHNIDVDGKPATIRDFTFDASNVPGFHFNLFNATPAPGIEAVGLPPIMSITDNGDGTMTLTGVSSGSGTVDGGLV